MNLRVIKEVIRIHVTQERMWEILSQYGDVSRFHGGVKKSYNEAGSENKAAPGCERVCHIVDMGIPITLKERITDYEEGKSYRYEVYEWKNFPLRKMLFGFEIISSGQSYVELAIEIAYQCKPSFLTPLMGGKMQRLAHGVLLGYKHFAETGEMRVPVKQLKSRYRNLSAVEVQYG